MKLRDILKEKGSEVYSVDPEATVAEAINLMVEKNIGSVVVMKGNRPVGIFTERDLLRRVCAGCSKDPAKTKVKEVMTSGVIYGAPDDDIQYAINVMTQHRIRHLPILESGKLVGIISIGDVLKQQYKEIEFENRVLKNYISESYPG